MDIFLFLLFAFVGIVFCFKLAVSEKYRKWGYLGFLILIIIFLAWGTKS
jgi:hypothetical protein